MRESKMLNSASQWFSSRSVNLMNTSQHTSCTSMTQSSDVDLDSHQQSQRPRSPPLPESSDSALRERDETIASLEKARLVETQTLSEVRSNLDELRETFRSELYWRDLEISQLRREKASAQERLKTMEADLRNEDLVRDMANLIMEAAPNDDHDSTSSSGSSSSTADGEYVTELQSKLCKAMHKMAVMSEQMKMMQQSCDEVVNSLKDELSEYVDEKCKAEVELLNRIDNLEHDKKSIEEQLGAKLDVKQNRIEKLEKAIDDLREVTAKNGQSEGGAIEASLSTVDAVLAIGELKHQVERLSREKDRMEDTYEQDLDMQRKELRRLQKANKRKQRKLERLDLEHNLRRVDGMAFGGETKICFSAGYVSEDDSDDEDDDGSDVQSQEEVALVALVNQIAAVTQNLEGELQNSIEKKEEVIASLEDNQDDDKSIEPMEEDGEPPHHTDISYARSSSSHEQRRTST